MAKARNPRPASPTTRAKRAVSVPAENANNGANESLEDAIRSRAYELYEQRGRQHGLDQQDWFRAEAEVRAQFSRRTA